jgi:hypothetical protein
MTHPYGSGKQHPKYLARRPKTHLTKKSTAKNVRDKPPKISHPKRTTIASRGGKVHLVTRRRKGHK